jgi:hypothetical protein
VTPACAVDTIFAGKISSFKSAKFPVQIVRYTYTDEVRIANVLKQKITKDFYWGSETESNMVSNDLFTSRVQR